MEANSLKHFYDALNAARAIQNFIADKTFEDYLADELLAAGVERKFEIIGDEARPARRWSMRSVGPKGVSSAGAHWAPNSQAFNRIRKESSRSQRNFELPRHYRLSKCCSACIRPPRRRTGLGSCEQSTTSIDCRNRSDRWC